MAILTEGFESWNDNGWSIVATGSATFAADETSKKTGTYGGNMYQAPAGAGIVWLRKYVGEYNPMSYEAQFKIASGNITTGDTRGLIRIVDSGGNGLFGLYLRKNVDGKIYLYTMTYGILSDYEITEYEIEIGTWYKVKIAYKTHAIGFYKVWLNEMLVYDETGNSSANNKPYGAHFGDSYGSATEVEIRLYYDDMVVEEYDEGPSTGILTRVLDVRVGKSAGTYSTLTSVKDAIWFDSDPWVVQRIPAGGLIHQNLRPNEILGKLTVLDILQLRTIFYETAINILDQYAVDPTTNVKRKIGYFVIRMKDHMGTTHTYSFTNTRIITIELASPEQEYGGEQGWTVNFRADGVVKA